MYDELSGSEFAFQCVHAEYSTLVTTMYFIIFFKATTKQAPTWMAPDVDTTLKLGLGLNIGVDRADRAVELAGHELSQISSMQTQISFQCPVSCPICP